MGDFVEVPNKKATERRLRRVRPMIVREIIDTNINVEITDKERNGIENQWQQSQASYHINERFC